MPNDSNRRNRSKLKIKEGGINGNICNLSPK